MAAPTITSRLLADKLENELQRELTDSGIHRRPKSAKVSIANRREVIDSAFVRKEIDLIKNIEKLAAQLQLVPLSYREDLRHPHVPGIKAGEPEAAFADIAERVLNRWIITCFECRGIQPQFARSDTNASPGRVWIHAGKCSAILADTRTRNI